MSYACDGSIVIYRTASGTRLARTPREHVAPGLRYRWIAIYPKEISGRRFRLATLPGQARGK